MPRYRVKAVDRSGKRITSFAVSTGVEEVRQSFVNRGWTVLRIRPIYGDRRQQRRLRKASNKTGSVLYRQAGELLSVGVPMGIALEDVLQLAPKGVLERAWRQVIFNVNQGDSLVDAFKSCQGLLAPRHLAMLRAAQSQKELAKILIDVSDEIAWRADTLRRWRQACTYPLFSVFLLFVVCVFLITKVVPSLVPMLASMSDELPWMTRKIMRVSNALQDGDVPWLAVVFTGAFSAVALWLTGCFIKRLPVVKTKILAFWLSSKLAQHWVWPFCVAAHAHTLHLLLKQNIPLADAVTLASPAAAWCGTNGTWKQIAERASHDGMLADAIKSCDLVPQLYVSLIQVGERHGILEESLMIAFRVFQARYERRLQSLDVLIGPILLICVGALMVCVFIWILLPVYDVIALQGGAA